MGRAPLGFQATLVTQISCLSRLPTCSPPTPADLTAGMPACLAGSPRPAALVSDLKSQGLFSPESLP